MTEETIKQILKFRDDRDWKQFHNPKDLAISISLEAAELLEVFQWSGADVSNEGKQERIKEELADVLNYCVLMADACGLDIDEIVQEKIKVNNEKYPVSKAKGKKNIISCKSGLSRILRRVRFLYGNMRLKSKKSGAEYRLML